MKITLTKALKLRKRYIGKLSELDSRIHSSNSYYEDESEFVRDAAPDLLAKRLALTENLILLRTELTKANAGAAKELVTLAEKKSHAKAYKYLPTDDGLVFRGEEDKPRKRLSWINRKDHQNYMNKLENEIAALQDELDEYNAKTKITLPDDFDMLND